MHGSLHIARTDRECRYLLTGIAILHGSSFSLSYHGTVALVCPAVAWLLHERLAPKEPNDESTSDQKERRRSTNELLEPPEFPRADGGRFRGRTTPCHKGRSRPARGQNHVDPRLRRTDRDAASDPAAPE